MHDLCGIVSKCIALCVVLAGPQGAGQEYLQHAVRLSSLDESLFGKGAHSLFRMPREESSSAGIKVGVCVLYGWLVTGLTCG
jgi:hypothetical protein